MRTKGTSETSQFWIILFLALLFIIVKSCSTQSKPSEFYLENKKAIDNYREIHEKDWDGFHGTRRNSWAEEEKLKHFGVGPEKYRKSHKY